MNIEELARKLGISTFDIFRRAAKSHNPRGMPFNEVKQDHTLWKKGESLPSYVQKFVAAHRREK